MSPEFLDRFSRGNTICHRLPVRLKIVLTLAAILAAALIPISAWPVHGCLACVLFAAHSVAEIPVAYLVRRVGFVMPLVCGLAFAVPLGDGLANALPAAAAIAVRSVLSLLAGLWLVNVTPFDRLLAGLQRCGMPRGIAAMLAFMYRYTFVVFDELAKMRAARRARTFSSRGAWREWSAAAQLLGRLLIRSLDRAERIHSAMCARGWDGRIRALE